MGGSPPLIGLTHPSGGIYLYESEAAVQAWMAGPIVAAMLVNPVLSNIDARTFDLLESHTKITRGPVEQVLDIAV